MPLFKLPDPCVEGKRQRAKGKSVWISVGIAWEIHGPRGLAAILNLTRGKPFW